MMNEKELRDLTEKTLETERKARAEKKRQIAALYAEIAAADTEAVGLAFRCYAEAKSGNTAATELAEKAFSSPAAMAVYDALGDIAELEYEC